MGCTDHIDHRSCKINKQKIDNGQNGCQNTLAFFGESVIMADAKLPSNTRTHLTFTEIHFHAIHSRCSVFIWKKKKNTKIMCEARPSQAGDDFPFYFPRTHHQSGHLAQVCFAYVLCACNDRNFASSAACAVCCV